MHEVQAGPVLRNAIFTDSRSSLMSTPFAARSSCRLLAALQLQTSCRVLEEEGTCIASAVSFEGLPGGSGVGLPHRTAGLIQR